MALAMYIMEAAGVVFSVMFNSLLSKYVSFMKKIIFPLFFSAALLFGGCSNAQSSESTTTDEQSTQGGVINKDVNAAEFAKLVNEGNGLVLDVRTDQEFNSGHIEGATQIDFFSPDFQQKIKALDTNKPVYVYCRSGNRSGQAAKMMKQLGFKEVYNLQGGVGAWQRNGNTLVK